jgi:hypothetical protein
MRVDCLKNGQGLTVKQIIIFGKGFATFLIKNIVLEKKESQNAAVLGANGHQNRPLHDN